MPKEYTQKQKAVIDIDHGYNMVLAGPGCGKTDILAERVVRAYENGRELSDMLCLTFTNRAAREMFNRIHERLSDNAPDLFVGNIHRYCSHFLFEEKVSGVTSESSIMDEVDTDEVLSSEIFDKDIKSLIEYKEHYVHGDLLIALNWEIVNTFLGIKRYPSGMTGLIKSSKASKIIADVRKRIYDVQHIMYQVVNNHPKEHCYKRDFLENHLLDNTVGFTEESIFIQACKRTVLCEEGFEDYKTTFLSLAYKYQQYKNRNGLLDFDDLLLYTYDAYYKDIKKEFKRFKWIQLDEIQDLSFFQLALVDLLTMKDDDYVVLYLGDEQQAIYSFMGASLNSLIFLKERCQRIYHLDKNFRSPKYLLDIYNDYAIKELNVDKEFLPKPKDEDKGGMYDVCIHEYSSEEEEAKRIKDAILPFLRDEKRKEERTALLVPWNRDADEISDQLRLNHIPHFKISGVDSFQTVHMRTLLAHLNAVSNDFNMIAWSRILKQTFAVDTFKEGRSLIEQMRKIGMCASDLLRDEGTYLSDYARLFDNEEIVLFDTETTGVDVFNDDIVQIAAYIIKGGEIVSNSFFNIIIELSPNKSIPLKLGKEDNPLIEIYDKTPIKYSHHEGLSLFMEYIGGRTLMGHNVLFDYNILKNNLNRYCGLQYDSFSATLIDTLKLVHLVKPNLRTYKLRDLVNNLGLVLSEKREVKYHQADEDIRATFELAKYCRRGADKKMRERSLFLQEQKTKDIKMIWKKLGYKDCYMHSKKQLFVLLPESCGNAITKEMIYISERLAHICEFQIVHSFDHIINFLNTDVISNPKPEPNALFTHFSNHLMDISSYREADLCSSSSFKEKLFVSTVHKAKGLEFENVLVMRSIEGRYPHYAHFTDEEKEEDKRLFYVAISRARKRLVVSGVSGLITKFVNSIIQHFLVRTELIIRNTESSYSGIQVLAEISGETLRVKKIERNNVYRKDYNIKQLYKRIKDQFVVEFLLNNSISVSDVFGSIEKTIHPYGGYIINNS